MVLGNVLMFKASQMGMDVRNTELNSYPSTTSYDVKVGTKKVFNTSFSEYLSCNSGWVDEEYYSTLKQLLASERILAWVKDDTGTYVQIPVKMRTKSLTKQQHLTEKLINYKVEFDYAFDTLNNVQ